MSGFFFEVWQTTIDYFIDICCVINLNSGLFNEY